MLLILSLFYKDSIKTRQSLGVLQDACNVQLDYELLFPPSVANEFDVESFTGQKNRP